jgi:hypothetical protein
MSDRAVVIRRGLRWLLGVSLFLAVPGVAQAATVLNNNDSGPNSLRAALGAATDGDTITFDSALNGQTITLTTGALMVTHSVTISGPGAGNLTINGGNNSSVFDVLIPPVMPPASTSVSISGLTITGGKGGDPGGGGILGTTVDTVTLTGDTISGNQATVRTNFDSGGGGVYVSGGKLVISNSTISNNGVTFNADARNSGGGGVYSNGGEVDVTGSDISHNTLSQASSSGESGGGGIYENGGTVDVATSTVLDNTVHITSSSGGDDGGGGIHSEGGGVNLTQAAIDGNSFTLDGGSGGDNGGGGVYEDGGDVTVVVSSIDGNSLTVQNDTGGDDGGGGLASEGGDIGVGYSSISNNTANVTDTGGDDGGGAILDEGGDSIYLNSTLSENSMTITGAGTFNGGGAILSFGSSQISNLTIAGNDTNMPGGAIRSDDRVQFKNTIVADNTATPAGNCAGTGTFVSAGFNLESANTCTFNGAGDLVNTDPQLGPLQNNGSPTPTPTLTQALAAGSPAVDAGSCTDIIGTAETIDQRGVARPQPAGGRCDIGAYELSAVAPPPPPPPPPSRPAAVPGTPAAVSSTGAGFSGSVNPEGQATTVVFQYGIDGRFRPGGATGIVYDQSTPPQSLPADSSSHAVSTSVTGLVPNALYHVRLVASSTVGTTFGPDQTFTTPADAAPPAPVLGRAVDTKPVSGKVFVLVGKTLVPLTEARSLPSGSVVDARAGSLSLSTAAANGHKPQTGVFSGAIFKLTQSRARASKGLTTLTLVENAFAGAPSYASCKAKGAHAAAVNKRTLQLLHGSAHGKFRTTGRYAAATVRGTKWTIADRCDGTLTHDLTDSVAVTDFVRHKTIVLHPGQSYLAQPRRRK